MKKKLSSLILLALAMALVPGIQVNALTFSPAIKEYTKNPGETITETLRLYNDSGRDVLLFPVFADFVAPTDESGSPSFVANDTFSDTASLAKWIRRFEPVSIKAGGKEEVKLTITIPQNAEPGGHYGAVLFSDTPDTTDNIGVAAQTGPILLVNVLGDIKEDTQLLDFKTGSKFYSSLPIDFTYRMENKGSVHESPHGKIKLSGWFPGTSEFLVNERMLAHVLPNSIRKQAVFWEGATTTPKTFMEKSLYEFKNFTFGYFTATLDLDYGVQKIGKLTGKTSFWVIPWHAFFWLAILILVLVFALKMYNKALVTSFEKKSQKIKTTPAVTKKKSK
jgi:hypothetical protein